MCCLRASLTAFYLPALMFAAFAWNGTTRANAQQTEPEETVELALSPAAAPRPALKYRLLPRYIDQKPGNAAVGYSKFMLEFRNYAQHKTKPYEKAQAWLKTPLEKLPKAEVEAFLDNHGGWMLSMLQSLSLWERSDWHVMVRDEQDPLGYLVPEAELLSVAMQLIKLKARLAIAQGQFEKAVSMTRQGLTMSRQFAQQPFLTLTNGGNFHTLSLLRLLEDFVQQEKAPNLYWALTALPDPLFELHAAIRVEQDSLFLLCPWLAELDSEKYSQEHWSGLVSKTFERLHYAAGLMSDTREQQEKNKALVKDLQNPEVSYPPARKRLLDRGYTIQRLESMSKMRVVLLDFVQMYNEENDDIMKWLFVPIPQGQKSLQQSKKRREALKEAGDAKALLPLFLLPSDWAPSLWLARTRQQIGALRCIEAIRIYAADHQGALPASLNETPQTPTPLDPISGQPFVYHRKGKTATLDLKNPDGGIHRRYRLKIGMQ